METRGQERLPAQVRSQFGAVDRAAVRALLEREIRESHIKFVILDDDPTGTQTVHDISVYTDWSVESVESGLREPGNLFYILTNSRAFTAAETEAAHREIADHIMTASQALGVPCVVVSRSDSTLRGHFPLETDTLRQVFQARGQHIDGEILCPFFLEGGRFTIHGVHYVQDGDTLVPAAQTEFARDKTFGYSASYLPDYIAEKTRGAFRAEDVTLISIEELRRMDYDGIVGKLRRVERFGKVCVDAVDYCDVEVFSVALYRAMAAGKRFLLRTAAGLVKAMGGIPDIPLLTRSDMVSGETGAGGVVVVGSHTRKTTEQLDRLLELEGTVAIPFNSDTVLEGDEAFAAEVRRCVALEEAAIRAGKTAVCFTKRQLLQLPGDTKEGALTRSVKISDGVQRLVGQLSVTPAFVVAKGGITSSTVATQALGIRRALVLGQVQPGIPVWQAGAGSKFPGIPYVVFPGNVGEAGTLRRVVEILTGSRP